MSKETYPCRKKNPKIPSLHIQGFTNKNGKTKEDALTISFNTSYCTLFSWELKSKR